MPIESPDLKSLIQTLDLPEDNIQNLLSQIDTLTGNEITQFMEIIKELSAGGESDTLNQILGDLYEETPVDVETFYTHPDYFGRAGADLYPKLMDDLIRLFNGNYTEVLCTGSIGWGKSYLVEMIIPRIVYEVSCLKNPQMAYNQAENATLFFPNISVNVTQAKKVIFGGIKEAIRVSPYFRDQLTFEMFSDEIRFPKKITLGAIAMSGALGENVFSAAMDETNFMEVVESSKQAQGSHFDQAEVIYARLARRMKSRFLKQGKLPGMLIMLSSVNYPGDFTERKKDEAKENPQIFVLDYPLWGTKPEGTYLSKKFWISMGTENQAPKVIENKDDADSVRNEGIETIEAPIDFLPDFKRDIEGSLKDIAGRSKLLINRFITQTEKIFELADAERKHPFTLNETTLIDGGKFIKELLAKQIPGSDGALVWRPIVSPYVRRFGHIDLAKTGDAAGFCVGHPKGEIQVTRRNEELGLYTESMPIVWIDIMLRIVPPQGEEINFGNIRSLLYELQSMGYLFEKVTLDSYQSSDTIQILNGRGIKSEELSIDKTIDPYNEVKSALYEDRLMMYWYDPVLEELKSLILSREGSKIKVDHLPNGSKDVSDCVAGVVYNCVQWMRNPKRQPPPAPSAGYMHGDSPIPSDKEDLGEDGWINE
ncbi:hypothetical protein KAR91_74895 [Candidatus Pacearchaeota archaeon]|nr:hypothetical protein [Candidatus Pacearchaeota archaeon]